jgi:hypothetical protein
MTVQNHPNQHPNNRNRDQITEITRPNHPNQHPNNQNRDQATEITGQIIRMRGQIIETGSK